MKYSNLRWAGDLLVSCSIDNVPTIFRSPIEKWVNDQLKPDSLATELLNLFSWGRALNDKILASKLESNLELIEGYYDKEGRLKYKGRILKDDNVLK